MKVAPPCLIVMLAVICSCNTDNNFPDKTEYPIINSAFTGTVEFKKLSYSTGFKILLKNDSAKIVDQKIFKYQPYRFDTADVNHDGFTEIIVGLIKSVRFDSLQKKRLFILRIDDEHIRPMWMGSKVCQELLDFKAANDGTIQTLERTKTGKFSIGSYYWESFGLTLEKYLETEISYDHALQTFSK